MKINLTVEVKDIPAAAANKEPPPPVKAQESVDVAKKQSELSADVPKDDKRVEPPVPEAPPKSKETVEQQVAAENAESKRVEPPVPVAPPADSNKEAAPKEVSNENKRVESAAPVDSAANKAAASPSSKPLPLPPKDSVKPDSGAAIETKKKKPKLPLPEAQKSLSNGEKRLLNEQKEIIQKMRGAKNQNVKPAAVKETVKKVESKEPSFDKRAPQSGGETKKVNAAPVIKNEVQREQKKMPLPLLVHSNAKDGNHVGEPPKREILENVAPDREKRDLFYVTEDTRENQPAAGSVVNASSEVAAALKPADVKPHEDGNVAEQEITESEPTHEESHKHVIASKEAVPELKSAIKEPREEVSVAKQKDDTAENLTCEKDSKSKAIDTKVVSQELSPDSNSEPAEPAAKKMAELQGMKVEERVDSKKDDEFAGELFVRSREEKKTATTSEENKSDGLVMAPSKLSDPIVRLPESVPIDDKLKPALLNVMKPMSRELKTVEDKPETNKKK